MSPGHTHPSLCESPRRCRPREPTGPSTHHITGERRLWTESLRQTPTPSLSVDGTTAGRIKHFSPGLWGQVPAPSPPLHRDGVRGWTAAAQTPVICVPQAEFGRRNPPTGRAPAAGSASAPRRKPRWGRRAPVTAASGSFHRSVTKLTRNLHV